MFIYGPPVGFLADIVTEETVRRKERHEAEQFELALGTPCSALLDALTTDDVPPATEPRSAKIPAKGSEPGAKGTEFVSPKPCH
jgi:hypothetical protein